MKPKTNVNEANEQNKSSGEEEIVSFKKASKILGVAESTLYKLTHERRIPFYKPGGKLIYFKKEDLITWMLRNKTPSNEEIQRKMINKLNTQKNDRRI